MPTTIPIMLRMVRDHPANRGRRARALMQMAAWQAYKRTIKRPFDIEVYGGVTFRCHPDSSIPGRFLYFGGWPDYEEMAFICRYLRPGDSFVDCGANVGMYTLLAAAIVGPTGCVHAFEGAPKAVNRLRENIALNDLGPTVVVHASAVSDTAGEVSFTVDRGEGSGNRIQTRDDLEHQTVTVPAEPLGSVLAGTDVAMCKLDIEGAEPLAFLGAEELLKDSNPPVWVLELQDRFVRRFGWTAKDLVRWLDERGYGMATYDLAANELTLGGEDLIETKTNLFAVAREQMDFIRDRLTQGRDTLLGSSVRLHRA